MISINISCTDPGIFFRGGPGQSDKKSFDVLFSIFIYFSEVKRLISKKLSFFKVPEGVQHFPGGGGGGGGVVQLFQGGGGLQLLIPYRNPYNM